MIDYLEALLEEEAGETEDSLLPGRRVLVRLPQKPAPDGEEEGEGSSREGLSSLPSEKPAGKGDGLRLYAPALARQTGGTEEASPSRGETEETDGTGEGMPPLADRLFMERRTVSAALFPTEKRGERAGEGLYTALRQAARTVRAGRQGTGTVSLSLPEPAAYAPSLTLADIDRAVQRDARRFDGGYTLY